MAKKESNVKAPTNKREVIATAIKAGGATQETLMEVASVDKSGLASQLSYLRMIAEATGKDFPMKGADGVFYMGTAKEWADYNEARMAKGPKAAPKSIEERIELATKREDKARVHAAKLEAAFNADNTQEGALRTQIAGLELQLASLLLAQLKDQNSDDLI